MPRLARIVGIGYPHHVIQRGNNRSPVFFDDQDRDTYLNYLIKHSQTCACPIHCYSLMTNHTHLLLTPQNEHSLSKTMQKLSLSYTQYFNKKYKRTGRLWECRYFSSLVDKYSYYWPVARLIETDAVRSKLIDYPAAYKWSSARFNLGLEKSDFITPVWENETELKSYINYFSTPYDHTELQKISNFTYSGKPIGSNKFYEDIFRKFGLMISLRPKGRPPKSDKFNKTPFVTSIVMVILLHLASLFFASSGFCYKFGSTDVKINASAGVRYDDNITFTKTDKRSDVISGLTAGISTKTEKKLYTLMLNGSVTEDIYGIHPKYTNTSENVNLTFESQFTRTDSIIFKEGFRHYYDPASFEDEFGRTPGIYSYYKNNIDFSYTRIVTKQFSLIGKYSNELNYVSRDDIKDSYLNSAGIEADYAFTTKTIGLLMYDFTRRNFVGGDDATTNGITGGIRQYFSNQFYAEARGGIDFIRNFDDSNSIRPNFFATLVDEIDEKTNIGATLLGEYRTTSYTQSIFRFWQIAAYINRELTKKLRGNVNAFYGRGDYTEIDETDHLSGFNTSLTYDIRDNIKGNLGYTISNTLSNDDSREYLKNVVLLKVTVEF